MKIRDIRLDVVHVNHRGDWAFVHVDTDEGVTGLGELRAGRECAERVGALKEIHTSLLGRDPKHIEALALEIGGSEPVSSARLYAWSAVEQALWDILGKALGVPVYQLLGGVCQSEIRLYANINRATTDRTPEGFARNAASAVADGFDAVKLAPFDGLPRSVERPGDAQPGLDCMKAVREAIGPDIDLLIDCHSRFTVRGALAVADVLRELDLFWFEQPTSEASLDDVLAVKADCGIRTAGGEQRALRAGFRDVLARQAMDVIMPDVTVIGGINELKKAAEMAEAWGVPTAPHGPFGPVSLAAGAHAMAAQPSFLVLEYAWGEIPWRLELTDPPENIRNGRLILSESPGLGLSLDRNTVETHRVEIQAKRMG